MGKKRDRTGSVEKKAARKKAKKATKIKVEPPTDAADEPFSKPTSATITADTPPRGSSNHQTTRPVQRDEEQQKERQQIKKKTSTKESSEDESDEVKPYFFKKKVRLSLSLLPSALQNSMAAIENCFRRMLLRYDDGMKGMLLAYDNVRIEDDASTDPSSTTAGAAGQGHGWILNELPYIHYNVSCTALVFSPSVGCELQGTVSQCFASHLSILVYGYVNAMIPSLEIREAGYVFDSELETWSKQGGSQTIAAGNKVNFLVNRIHECDGTLSIEGIKPVRSLLVELVQLEE